MRRLFLTAALAAPLLSSAAGQERAPQPPPGAVPAEKGSAYRRAAVLPARILSFSVQPDTIQPGQSVTLSWATENQSGITLAPA